MTLLLYRDYDIGSITYWIAILSYILEYIDETDIFDENSLGQVYRLFYYALKEGQFSRIYLLLDKLRRDLTLGSLLRY